MTILQRYVLREIIAPIGLGLVVFTFVFLIGQIFKLTDILLNSGVPASLAGEMILLILPGIMSLTIPMSILVGTLLGFGRLAADREILAIRTNGVNLFHVCLPVIVFGVILTGVMAWANMKIVPYLNLKSADVRIQLMFNALSAIPAGQPYVMPNENQGMESTFFFSQKNLQTGEMHGIVMQNEFEDKSGKQDEAAQKAEKARKKAAKKNHAAKKKDKSHLSKEQKLAERRLKEKKDWDEIIHARRREAVIVAQNAVFRPNIRERLIDVELTSGSVHITDPDNQTAYDTIRFSKLTKGIVPSFNDFDKSGSFEKDPREMSVAELRKQIAFRDKGHKYSSEIYRRFSITLACIAFAMIALPLGVYARPTGKAVAFAISFLLILLYYGLLEYGTALTQGNSPAGPFVIFLPNLLLTGVGAVMMYRMVMK